MCARNKVIQRIEKHDDIKLKLSEKFENLLFTTNIPRMPKYKIIKLNNYLNSITLSNPDSEIFKSISDEIRECIREDVSSSINFENDTFQVVYHEPFIYDKSGEDYFIVDEIGELLEDKNIDFYQIFSNTKMLSEFNELINKVEYYDPLNCNLKKHPNIFEDAVNLDLKNSNQIEKFCNKYGLLFISNYYLGYKPKRDQNIINYEFLSQCNLTKSYLPGKLSLSAFRSAFLTFQSLALLWCYFTDVERGMPVKNNREPYNENYKKDLEQKYTRKIDELKDIYKKLFRKEITILTKELYLLTPEKIKKELKFIQTDIIKIINNYIFDVRPEIYETKINSKPTRKYRFVFNNLLQALYLILFNIVTDNGVKFFICDYCGKINELVHDKGHRRYCYNTDANGIIIDGHSDCQRAATNLKKFE